MNPDYKITRITEITLPVPCQETKKEKNIYRNI